MQATSISFLLDLLKSFWSIVLINNALSFNHYPQTSEEDIVVLPAVAI